MNENLNLYIKHLKNKNDILNEIFQYVYSKDFKISEDEIQHIENYFNKREKLYNELKIIENNLKNMKMSDSEKNDKNVIKIVNENDKLIKAILDIDQKTKIKLDNILSVLKGNIKSIKSVEKASKNYFGVYNSFSGGNYFDSQRWQGGLLKWNLVD